MIFLALIVSRFVNMAELHHPSRLSKQGLQSLKYRTGLTTTFSPKKLLKARSHREILLSQTVPQFL